MRATNFAAKCENARKSGDGWSCKCPAHEDRQNSLSVADGDGKVVIHCFAGCKPHAIAAAVGVRMQELWHDYEEGATEVGNKNRENVGEESRPRKSWDWGKGGRSRSMGGRAKRVVATYEYCNTDGSVRYKVQRLEPKSFRMVGPDGKPGVKGIERTLYNAPMLAEGEPTLVFFVEGEKDADTLTNAGLVATTLAGGSNAKLTDEMVALLERHEVVCLPDNDVAGQDLWLELKSKVSHARRVMLPVGDKQDVTDWFEAGNDAGDLLSFIKLRADEWQVPGLWGAPFDWEALHHVPPLEWDVKHIIAKGDQVGMIYGPSGEGKTFVAIDLMMHMIKGHGLFAGRFEIRDAFTVIYATDEGFNGIPARMFAAAKRHAIDPVNKCFVYNKVPQLMNLANDEGVDAFIEQWRQRISAGAPKPDVLVLDTLHNASVGADENSNAEMGLVIAACKKIARELDLLVILIHHTGKSGEYRGASSILADMSFMIRIEQQSDGTHTMKRHKTKESEPWPAVRFELVPDEEYNTVTVEWKKPYVDEYDIRETIRQVIEGTSDSLSKTALVAAVMEEIDVPRQKLRNFVDKMVADGDLRKMTHGKGYYYYNAA